MCFEDLYMRTEEEEWPDGIMKTIYGILYNIGGLGCEVTLQAVFWVKVHWTRIMKVCSCLLYTANFNMSWVWKSTIKLAEESYTELLSSQLGLETRKGRMWRFLVAKGSYMGLTRELTAFWTITHSVLHPIISTLKY